MLLKKLDYGLLATFVCFFIVSGNLGRLPAVHDLLQSLLERCRPLIQYTADPVEILESYDASTDADGFYMVMDQPCFGRFYDEATIGRYLRPELPFYDRLEAVAQKRFGRLRTAEQFYTIFTRSGLERFQATGSLDDFPVAFVAPFPPEQRRQLMLALAGHIRSGDITGRILETGSFPDYLSMTTSRRSGLSNRVQMRMLLGPLA